jgi:hypothetical protein
VKIGRKQYQTVFIECSFRKTLAIQKRNARGFKKDHPLPSSPERELFSQTEKESEVADSAEPK